MKLLTVRESAVRLRISPWTLYRLIANGKFPAAKLGGQYRINEDELVRLMSPKMRHA